MHLHDKKLTFYLKTFESYCIADRQADRQTVTDATKNIITPLRRW